MGCEREGMTRMKVTIAFFWDNARVGREKALIAYRGEMQGLLDKAVADGRVVESRTYFSMVDGGGFALLTGEWDDLTALMSEPAWLRFKGMQDLLFDNGRTQTFVSGEEAGGLLGAWDEAAAELD
jgi:hypothetical protein